MANNSNGLHLPGTFTSFPKGQKPKHYAPHAQPSVSSHGVTPGRHGGQPTISAFTPFVGQHHNISPFEAPDRAPRHNISAPNLGFRNPIGHIRTVDEARADLAKPSPHGHLRTVAEARADLPGRTPHGHIRTRQEALDDLAAQRADPKVWSPKWAKHPVPVDKANPPLDNDPMGNFYFVLEISSDNKAYNEVATFRECSGLKTGSEVFEIIEGGLNGRTHRRPGQSKWENIVIKYASSSSTFLLEWRDLFLQDKFSQRLKYSGSIALLNNNSKVVRRYNFTNAWPVSWEGPALNAGGSDLAVETLEIAHEGLTMSLAPKVFTKTAY